MVFERGYLEDTISEIGQILAQKVRQKLFWNRDETNTVGGSNQSFQTSEEINQMSYIFSLFLLSSVFWQKLVKIWQKDSKDSIIVLNK